VKVALSQHYNGSERPCKRFLRVRIYILDGKLKKKFYSSMLMAYNVAWKNVVREIFGEDIEYNEQNKEMTSGYDNL